MKPRHHPVALAFVAMVAGCIAGANEKRSDHWTQLLEAPGLANVAASFSLIGTSTAIQTGSMPASWYIASPNDVPITVIWHTSATKCKPSEIASFGSDNSGYFAQILEIGGEFAGFSWSAHHDVAGLEHHWHNFIRCDGTSIAVGCKDARTVVYSLSVAGHCSSLDANCAAFGSVSLPAIQDGDEQQTNCPVKCPISLARCKSACEATCFNDSSLCGRCCECDCKDAIHEQYSACPAPQASCYAASAMQPACL